MHVAKNAPRGFGILSVGRLRRKCFCVLTLHAVTNAFSDAFNKHWHVGPNRGVPMLYKTTGRLSEQDLWKLRKTLYSQRFDRMIQYPMPLDTQTEKAQPNGKDTTVENSRTKPTKGKPHQPHYELKGDGPLPHIC